MSDDLEKITGSLPATPRDRQIAQLENDLQTEKDSRKTERFVMLLAGIILADALILRDAGALVCLFTFFLEIVLVLYVAEKLGINRIYTIMTNALDMIDRVRGKKENGGNGR